MSEFTQRIAGLEVTFPQSGLAPHEPGMLTDYVQLIHPAFGPLQRIGKNERQAAGFSGAAGVTVVNVTTGPAGRVRVVEFCSAEHDDPVARHVLYRITPQGGAISTHIQNTQTEGNGAALAALDRFPLKRRVALGPGDVLVVQIGVAAGFAISGSVVFIDYSAADVPQL